MPVPYKHEKLASVSTIRIIKVERERVDGRIACTIRHVEQAAEDAVYDALSYVWGNPAATIPIRIKNTRTSEWNEFMVHENLWRLLTNVWEREAFDHWLWTDRICLDQSDGSEELGEQIPRMTEIYRNAAQVVAWLGMEDSDARVLIQVSHALREGYEFTKEGIAERFSEEIVAVIAAVRNSEYWKRIWIVQEFVSAQKLVVVVGNFEFTLDQMDRVLVAETDDNDKAAILNMLRNWTKDGDHVDLWDWLSQITSQDFKCTKPHDLVYGILGLAITYGSGKSRPHLIRKACYEEPHAYVIIDALFESSTNFFYNPSPINLLLRTSSIVDSGVFTAFEGYINSDRTSDRHRNLACLFLQTCDAFFSALSPFKSKRNWPFQNKDFQEIMRVTFLYENSEYAQHTAVLLGLGVMFSAGDQEEKWQIFQNWKDIRDIRPEARNRWKCRNHLPYLPRNRSKAHDLCEGPEHDRSRKYSLFYRKGPIVFGHTSVSLTNLDASLKQACSSREDCVTHSACHESIVGFQIPEAGFRLEMELSRDRFSSGISGKSVAVWFWPPEDDIGRAPAVHTDQ